VGRDWKEGVGEIREGRGERVEVVERERWGGEVV